MPRPLPVDYLQDDEEILHQTGRHGLSVLDEIIGALVLAGLVVAGVLVLTLGFFPDLFLMLAVPVIATVVLLLGIFLLTRWFRVATSIYTITDQRVYKAYGRLRFFLSQTTYDKLTDLHVRQSFFGRLRGFGTVRLETAGTGIALDGLRDPFGSKQRIESARAAFIHQLVGEAPPRAGAQAQSRGAQPEAQEAPVGEEPVWSAGPAAASFVGSFVTLLVMLTFAAAGIVGATVFRSFGWQALMFPAALLLLASANAVGIWVRLRYTRYHVARRGVYITSGWLSRRRVETTYAKVTDVTVYQGLLGRMMDFGSITINTAGSNTAPVVFAGVTQPESVKRLIDEARRAWER